MSPIFLRKFEICPHPAAMASRAQVSQRTLNLPPPSSCCQNRGPQTRRNQTSGEVVYPSGNVVPVPTVHHIGVNQGVPQQAQQGQYWIAGMVPQSPVTLVPPDEDD